MLKNNLLLLIILLLPFGLQSQNIEPDVTGNAFSTATTEDGSTTVQHAAIVLAQQLALERRSTHRAQFRLRANAGLEMGELSYKFWYHDFNGRGWSISGEFLSTPRFGVGLSAGHFTSSLEGERYTMSITPVTLIGRCYFRIRRPLQPFIGIDIGVYQWEIQILGDTLHSAPSLGVAPVLGLLFKITNSIALDVNAKYTTIFSEARSHTFLGFNAGIALTFGR